MDSFTSPNAEPKPREWILDSYFIDCRQAALSAAHNRESSLFLDNKILLDTFLIKGAPLAFLFCALNALNEQVDGFFIKSKHNI